MTIAPHFLAGSAVAVATTNNIPLAFLVGFFLHFILDAIPHVDPGTFHNIKVPFTNENIELGKTQGENKPWPLWIYVFAVLEFIITIFFVWLLFKDNIGINIIIAGGLGGIAVDVIHSYLFNFTKNWPVFKQLNYIHEKIHFDLDRTKWYWGLIPQVAVIVVSLWILLK